MGELCSCVECRDLDDELIAALQQKDSLLTKKIPEPPGRSHPDRPSRLIKGDRLLDMRAKGFREIDKVPDRAEMNVLRFIPLTRKPSGHGHPTEE